MQIYSKDNKNVFVGESSLAVRQRGIASVGKNLVLFFLFVFVMQVNSHTHPPSTFVREERCFM